MENTHNKPAITYSQNAMNWQALSYFNYYRILLSVLFLLLIYMDRLPQPLGGLDKPLFSNVCHIYLLLAIVFNFLIHVQFPRFKRQIAIHVLTDIIILSLLMYASDGLSSGFGLLIAIAVAGGSLLRVDKIAILLAAIATLSVLGHELYIQFIVFHVHATPNYTHAGILGATFFITTIIGNILATRAKKTEILAKKQAIEIDELAKLNEHIVQRMQSGILVLDNDMNILLINEKAKQLLGQQEADIKKTEDIYRCLQDHIHRWLHDNGPKNVILKLAENDVELQTSFIKLTLVADYQILVFLSDISYLQQRAQQLKFASLGRLTASIAHEVRNPLGAINHAGQLLRESASLSTEDQRLTEIINDHSLRINNIIENVLSISRREKTTADEFALMPWLEKFIEEFETRFDLAKGAVQLTENKQPLSVRMDPSQLHQVLWNLCENAMRYSQGRPLITLSCAVNEVSQRPYLDIIDYGLGIADAIKEQLFEPFFTTETKGSGLGLYLARELCVANRATLSLQSNTPHGAVFRLSFMPTDEQGELF